VNAPETEIRVSDELREALADLVKCARILELHGHSDRIWGHVSMRDPEGRGFWLKRHAISLGEVYAPEDFQLISFEGHLLHGEGRRHSEWPIHGEIYVKRPDILYIGHTHPTYGSIYSSIPDPLHFVRGNFDGRPNRYEGSSELVTTREVGAQLADALEDAMWVFMRNHGIVFCGTTPSNFVQRGISMEEACLLTLTANGSGFAWRWPDEEEESRKGSASGPRSRGDALWDHLCRILARAEAVKDIRLSHSRVPPN
jgi:L-fuculose-phosphate aldolase